MSGRGEAIAATKAFHEALRPPTQVAGHSKM